MGVIEKWAAIAGAAVLVVGAFWYLIQSNQDKAEEIGKLEAERQELVQSVKDSERSAEQARVQLEMWQWLYDDLQGGYQEVQAQRAKADAELAALKEQRDVQDYLECPMPDSLYDWVRNN